MRDNIHKGAIMEVSSSTGTNSSVQIEAQKKATEVQERQVLKVLEGAEKLSQETTAHKTGVGSNLNVSA